MRLPRFSLRTVFVAVTVGAVVCWAYFIGWPAWQLHCIQVDLENDVKQFHAGEQPSDLSYTRYELAKHVEGYRFSKDTTLFWRSYIWSNAIYLLIFEVPDLPSPESAIPPPRVEDRDCLDFKLYRLPPAPFDYVPHTSSGRDAMPVWNPNCTCTKGEYCYLSDFVDDCFNIGKADHSVRGELIYSNPPK